ncbi:hypothetical protein ABT299_30240 [Spirillospora sp. NPDC000708]
MPSSLSELHEPFVEWVYDHSDDAPAGHVDFREFSEAHGLTLDASFELLRQCKDHGFMADSQSTLGTPMAKLSGYGRRWVEARRRRRTDKVQRVKAARNRLLVWLWERQREGAGMPVVEDFLKSPKSIFEGAQMAPDEIDQAAASLRDKGLIHGIEVAQRRGPVRAETTDEGNQCVEEHDGDVSEYERSQRTGGVHFGGDNKGAFSVGGYKVQNNSTFIEADTAAKAMGVVEQYRQAKPTIPLPAEVEAEVVEAIDEVEREIASGTPDKGRLRHALERAGNHLNTAVAGAVGNLIAAGALELAAQLH